MAPYYVEPTTTTTVRTQALYQRQSKSYTDERIDSLRAELVQEMTKRTEYKEVAKCDTKLTIHLIFLIVGIAVGFGLAHLHGIPTVAAITAGTLPNAIREVIDRLRKL